MKRYLALAISITAFSAVTAQSTGRMDFEKYDPPSTLVVEEHKITRSKFAFVDVHNHQGNLADGNIQNIITEMDRMNMKVMVNLSGGSGERLRRSVAAIRKHAPGRILIFANIDFNGIGEKGWAERTVKQLEEDVKAGASGLKIFKNLGFSVTDNSGKRVSVDDPRLSAIWEKCGELKIPVLIHTADPPSFWQAPDERNERWLELATHPRRQRSDTDPAPFEALLAEQHRIFRKHSRTTFIAAHFGWMANDLARLSRLLDELPNVVVEFGAVIAELGRQPRAAHSFFKKYQDQILFGKDSWVPAEYATYFRVLETADEYFPYHKRYHAFWRMYGMNLPDDILRKVYYQNALRIIPGMDRSMFK